MTPPTSAATPNHHADHPPFAGAGGLLAALSMLVGRDGDSRLAADRVALGPHDRVVDIGCGPGTAAREAARRGASVIGVDPAAVMLTVARRVPRRSGPIEWREGVAESLPVADTSATVVWSLAAVHHWDDIDGGLLEARRVLVPDGRLLAIERRVQAGATGHASHGWTPAQADAFAAASSRLGFTDVSVEEHRARRGPLLVVQARRP
jgi:SAM-dependent methyltransferase